MRFIDKSIYRAKQYKRWEEDLNAAGKDHPLYTSSKSKFYYGIVFDLLKCQKGLCAYTERFLCSVDEHESNLWVKDRCHQFRFAGQLDHYDPRLKTKSGWLWDNFFIVDSDLNMKEKRDKPPSGILKPDLPNFDARTYLDYDFKIHFFFPKAGLSSSLKANIKNDLLVLGINFEPIVQARKEYLNPYLNRLKYKQQDMDSIKQELFQFHTAFLMSSGKIS